jgi:hypothetical protein
MDTTLMTFMVYVKISFPPVVEFDIAFASHSLCRIRIYGGLDPIIGRRNRKSRRGSTKRNLAGRYLVETSQVFTHLPLKSRKQTNTAL